MLSVFMVAEKPSICTSIAKALGGPHLQSHTRSPPVYEFNGTFEGQQASFKVTSVVGHIFSLDFPGKYQNWDSVDPNDLFDAPTLKTPEGKGGIVKHLEREAKGSDVLVLWMDCDREGENICFEVIHTVQHVMKKSSRRQSIYRAKFSAVTKKDIDRAMASLVSPNENEALSVDARQELDLKVGVAFSRFQTRYFQGKYGNLDSSVISYGPCQTPTLGFCVERYDEIQSFVPEPFWTIDAKIQVDAAEKGKAAQTRNVSVSWQRGRLFDQGTVDMFLHRLQRVPSLRCTSVKTTPSRRMRPQPLNTVELLRRASSVLGIGPHAAMRAAENLYLSGYISYPRTESTAYPSSFDFREVLAGQREHHSWGRHAEALVQRWHPPRAGHDAGDHPPITPVGLATELEGDSARIYELVCRHFLATISSDAKYEVTTVQFVADEEASRRDWPSEKFSLRGRREVDAGFLSVYGPSSLGAAAMAAMGDVVGDGDGEEEGKGEGEGEGEGDEEGDMGSADYLEDLPSFAVGSQYPVAHIVSRTGQTSPPGPLTESELITKMEKHGIGTDASIPTHIQNILTRNYVTLGPGRTLLPTELGVVLVHGYLRIDADLVLPDIRAAIEAYCSLIAKGAATKEAVVQHSLASFQRKFQYFTQHIGMMNALFEASFDPLAASGKSLSKCGKCRHYMRYISLRPQRLYCATCEQTYALPQNGTIKLYKELKCPLDDFELVLYSLGNSDKAQGKSFPLCPYCYNHPPKFSEEEEEEEEEDAEGESEEGEGEDEADEDEEDDGEEKGEDEEVDVGGGHMGCNTCMHPSCAHSAARLGVCGCISKTVVVTSSPPVEPAAESHASHSRAERAPSAGGRGGRGHAGRGRRGGRSSARGGGRGEERAAAAASSSSSSSVPPLAAQASLAPITFTCEGLMVLDVNSKPNWKLACNQCNTLWRFKAEAHQVSVLLHKTCAQCSAKLVEVEFNKLKTPLPQGQTKYVGCLRCDAFLAARMEVIEGRSISLQVLRQQRQRRRLQLLKMGKGRGRGRGRGKKSKTNVLMSFEDF